jgi:hypothetical protein
MIQVMIARLSQPHYRPTLALMERASGGAGSRPDWPKSDLQGRLPEPDARGRLAPAANATQARASAEIMPRNEKPAKIGTDDADLS